jgi:membrane-associated phospholipid phosphatase
MRDECSKIVPLASSLAALGTVFWGLLQLDLPIVHYLRTVTTHQAGEQLTIPWMALTSDIGNWIGDGWHLAAASLALVTLGWMASRPQLTKTGIETAIGHGLAALLSNGLKHLIGRPRPKFIHSGEWQFTPSFASGLDSFPSGHTTASFAVATVLAKRFPAFSSLFLGIAAFVGLSRVLRGSHFSSDVFGGIVIGVLSGSVAAHPWRQWRISLVEWLRQAAVGTTVLFAVLWTLARPGDAGASGVLLIGVGLLALAGGVWLRRGVWVADQQASALRQEASSRALIAYGLACMTTAPLVVAAAGFAGFAYWFAETQEKAVAERRSRAQRIVTEGALVASLLLALSILFQARGILPFQ